MIIDKINLINQALEAREMSYSPYSGFAVGAALLGKSGKVYQGCNIENAAYTPSNCGERTAFFKAVSEGEKEFTAISVVGGPKEKLPEALAWPCGVCRQVMMEFCDPETFVVIVAKNSDEYEEYLLKDILPKGFSPKDLAK